MMLHLLVEYAQSHNLTVEPGFKPKMVKWGIRFTPEGKLSGVVALGNREEEGWRGQVFLAAPDLLQPELVGGTKSGDAKRCHFLIESASVVCRYHEKGADAVPEKDRAKHAYFVNLLKDAAPALPGLAVVARALADNATLAEIHRMMKALPSPSPKNGDATTVGLDGYPGVWFVVDNQWHSWWKNFRKCLSTKSDSAKKKTVRPAVRMRCLVSGSIVEPAASHPKVEGLSDVGGLGTGTSLVSFDKDALASYSLEESSNAAASERMAWAYRNGLNWLIDSDKTKSLAGAKIVHWYVGEQPDDDPIDWLTDLDDAPADTKEADARAKARALLDAIRAGRRPELARARFYALTLSGAAGRVMVRDWMEGQFEELVRNVSAWFDDLEMVDARGELSHPPRFLWVVGALVKRMKDKPHLEDVPAPLQTRLWRSAIRGEPIPDAAQSLALDRFRSEILKEPERIGDPVRMGLLRAHLIRKGDLHMKPRLNPDHPDPAYHCGRVLAVLARLQEAALGGVGAGVVQRFYPAASTTPALVLGRLVRTAQFHADKLSSKGLAHWYQQQIAGIMAALGDSIPRTLTLEQQSVFALGFYQQYAGMTARKDQPETDSDKDTKEAAQ